MAYAATNPKKFLDADGLSYFSQKLNQYPTNDVIAAVVDGVQDALDEKVDTVSVGANNGVASLDNSGKVPASQLNAMTGATSSADGAAGLVPAPTSQDTGKFLRGDGTWQDGGRPMVILSYGNSTWQDFIAAYKANAIVYARASSNANPASGSQTRMAFMAYVNNADNPANVEFQYVRSIASHSDSQQIDQVFVYKLQSSGWSVETRDMGTTIAVGSNLTSTYSGNKLTINNVAVQAAVKNGTAGSLFTTGNKWDYERKVFVLNYGTTTWEEFETNYDSKKYFAFCRATDEADPTPSGNKAVRLAPIAFKYSTYVDFQYVKAPDSNDITHQGADVYVYRLDSVQGWSYEVRHAYSIVEAGTNLTSSYSGNTITLNAGNVVANGGNNDATSVSSLRVGTSSGTSYLYVTTKDGTERQINATHSSLVTNVAYDSTNAKITKTINGTTSDVVTASTLKTAMSLNNVENKSSATIRGELTSSNVTTALGYTPLDSSSVITNSQIDALFA